MSKAMWIILGAILVLLICVAALSVGILAGRASMYAYGWLPGRTPRDVPGAPGTPFTFPRAGIRNVSPLGGFLRGGWLSLWRMGPGMMGRGMMGRGMMGGALWGRSAAEPISLDEAEQAVEAYLSSLGNTDLAVKEVMVFDNQAYAEIYEQSTGIGAMEVLVDPSNQEVYPEPGPNMMWNLKYGMMSTGGMGHGMMGGWRWWRGNPRDVSAEMPIGPDEALEIAQKYLDANYPGVKSGHEADPFYGYYTIHTLENETTTGMLSVNGYSGEVFPHTWHGKFIEMSEEHGS